MQKYDDAKKEFIKNNIKKKEITNDFHNYNNIIKEIIIIECGGEENPFEIERKVEMKLKEDI